MTVGIAGIAATDVEIITTRTWMLASAVMTFESRCEMAGAAEEPSWRPCYLSYRLEKVAWWSGWGATAEL